MTMDFYFFFAIKTAPIAGGYSGSLILIILYDAASLFFSVFEKTFIVLINLPIKLISILSFFNFLVIQDIRFKSSSVSSSIILKAVLSLFSAEAKTNGATPEMSKLFLYTALIMS